MALSFSFPKLTPPTQYRLLIPCLIDHNRSVLVQKKRDQFHFNFGDSNSDTGGLSASFWPAPEPNGKSFWGHPAGRYSDDLLVIDFIANSLGLPYLDAYLNSLGTNFSHGASFATAGETIRRPDTTLFESGLSPFPLYTQFTLSSQFNSRSQIISEKGLFKDVMPKGKDFSQVLYTFGIGQNDLTHCFFNNMTSAEVKE